MILRRLEGRPADQIILDHEGIGHNRQNRGEEANFPRMHDTLFTNIQGTGAGTDGIGHGTLLSGTQGTSVGHLRQAHVGHVGTSDSAAQAHLPNLNPTLLLGRASTTHLNPNEENPSSLHLPSPYQRETAIGGEGERGPSTTSSATAVNTLLTITPSLSIDPTMRAPLLTPAIALPITETVSTTAPTTTPIVASGNRDFPAPPTTTQPTAAFNTAALRPPPPENRGDNIPRTTPLGYESNSPHTLHNTSAAVTGFVPQKEFVSQNQRQSGFGFVRMEEKNTGIGVTTEKLIVVFQIDIYRFMNDVGMGAESTLTTMFPVSAVMGFTVIRKMRWNSGQEYITDWASMRRELVNRFVPCSYEEDSFTRLQGLRQKLKNVDEYANEFYLFSSRVATAETETQKVSRFKSGLTKKIQDELTMVNIYSVAQFQLRRQFSRLRRRLRQQGHVQWGTIVESSVSGAVFIAISLILGDGLYNLVKIIAITVKEICNKSTNQKLPILNEFQDGESSKLSIEQKKKDEIFLKDRIPSWVAASGYVGLAAISTATIPVIFPPLKWYLVLSSYVIAPALAFCNSYGSGLTDWSLATTYGKIGLFIFASAVGSNGGVIAGLVSCGVMMSIVATAADLMQDFKTGYLTFSSAKSMFVSQLVGTAMGCIIAPLTFWLFWTAFDIGDPNGPYKAPYAVIFREMAILGVKGFSELPKHCLAICCGFFVAALIINLSRDVLPSKISQFIPIPMAMAIPFYIGAYFAIDMFVGTVILFVWEKINRKEAEDYAGAVASGLICGDGIWTIPSAVLSIFRINPPICMYFGPSLSS
ncbi:hypothetical protein GIB67_039234 [Kingdonia uniflora]|uniref:Retrotransposon gag domain-containing protein n=1 Tax=Kingdonia uniflora TaxID=39325 RepID=A0A7J7MLY5_9MAGN|nr:hypothetical protein GIB67_039234 [Kingdonia uniflora]